MHGIGIVQRFWSALTTRMWSSGMFECEEDGARYSHPQVTIRDIKTLGFKGVVWRSPFGALAQDQEGGQCSQGRFSEFPESSDPAAGLKVFRV